MGTLGECTGGPEGELDRDPEYLSISLHLAGTYSNGGSGGHWVFGIPPIEDRGVLAWSWYGGRDDLLMLLKNTDDRDPWPGLMFLFDSCGQYFSVRNWLCEPEARGWKMVLMLLRLCWVFCALSERGRSSWQIGLSWKSSPSIGM